MFENTTKSPKHRSPIRGSRGVSVVCVLAFLLTFAGLPFFDGDARAHDIFSREGFDPVLQPVPDAYVEAVTGAARDFIDTLDADQIDEAVAPYGSPNRTSGRDTSHTPVFCAILAWCKGWGVSQCSLSYQQRQALTRLLSTALSDSGYQTVRVILNSHRLIGELEDVADAHIVGEIARNCPTLEAQTIFDVPESCLPDNKDLPDYVALGGAAPTDSTGDYKIVWQWPNNPPGYKVRYEQFCDHNIAVFGEPGSDLWAFRFEGHHVTVNLTFARDPTTGQWRVAMTPLFLGSFPMVVPPSPDANDDRQQLTWEAAQELMRAPLDHARRFVAALPDDRRRSAFVPASDFPQEPPLRLNQFPNWLLSSTLADPTEPLPQERTRFATSELNEDAEWHLRSLFRRYFDTMHPVVGDQYEAQFDELFDSDTAVSVIWAGDPPTARDGAFFLRVAVGSLLLEINADNEWSTQHRATPRANHVHSMLRDLSFRWDYNPADRTPAADHHKTNELSNGTGAH